MRYDSDVHLSRIYFRVHGDKGLFDSIIHMVPRFLQESYLRFDNQAKFIGLYYPFVSFLFHAGHDYKKHYENQNN